MLWSVTRCWRQGKLLSKFISEKNSAAITLSKGRRMRNGKGHIFYSTQQHLFKVAKTGTNALNSLFFFSSRSKSVAWSYKTLSRQAMSESPLSTCSPLEQRCFHSTATKKMR